MKYMVMRTRGLNLLPQIRIICDEYRVK